LLRARREPPNLLDQRRQRRFGIRRDRQVDLGVALEILVVATLKEMLGHEADDLRVAMACLACDVREVSGLEREHDVGVWGGDAAGVSCGGGGGGAGAWRVAARSTMSSSPAGVRAARLARMTGFSAATSSFATSEIAPESAAGGVGTLSLGMRASAGACSSC